MSAEIDSCAIDLATAQWPRHHRHLKRDPHTVIGITGAPSIGIAVRIVIPNRIAFVRLQSRRDGSAIAARHSARYTVDGHGKDEG